MKQELTALGTIMKYIQIKLIWKAVKMPNYKHLWLIKVRSRDALIGGNVSLSRNRGFASISFLSSISMMLRADFVSPYLDSCSFCLQSTKRDKLLANLNFRQQRNRWKRWSEDRYLKFSSVSNWVISLKSSSLKEEKTLRSFTRISTAFPRSCLQKGFLINNQALQREKGTLRNEAKFLKANPPIKSFKVLLFPNLKEYFHRIPIVFNLCEPAEVLLNLVPFSCLH